MKQTNNAIKFLMAQYRAIFKNANIAMAIAAATAALAAGQAQADTKYWTDLTGNENTLSTTQNLEGNGDIKSKGSFSLSIAQGGKLSLGGDTGIANFKPVDKGTGSITIDGGELEIGRNHASGAAVTLTDLTVKAGTAHVGGATNEASSLTADTIVIGSKPASSETPDASAKAAAAKFTVGGKGSITANKTLTIYKGGELQFFKAATDTSNSFGHILDLSV